MKGLCENGNRFCKSSQKFVIDSNTDCIFFVYLWGLV